MADAGDDAGEVAAEADGGGTDPVWGGIAEA